MEQLNRETKVSEAPSRQCAQCGKPLGAIPLRAPHKRFCSKECRQSWHESRRKRALSELKPDDTTTTTEG